MQKFSEQFKKIEHCKGKVILEHKLFDRQVHRCEDLHIIDDNSRIGLIIKNQHIYIDKQSVKFVRNRGNIFTMSDDMLSITVIVNKL